MRLELGSGDRPTEGFIHLDVRPDVPHVDIVDDASILEFVDEQSCEEIRACHLLEHFSHRDTLKILRLWRTRLCDGGVLHVEVPNLEGHVLAWQSTRSTTDQFVEYLYGSQDYPGNYHKTLFTTATLDAALRIAGYREITMRNLGLVIAADGKR